MLRDAYQAKPSRKPLSMNSEVQQHPLRTRLIALALLVPSLAVLVTAALLEPNPAGVETHLQLGLSPCGFYRSTGIPGPDCGFTTSFALAADGRILQAFLNQPAGAALAVLTAVVIVASGYILATGASLWFLLLSLLRPWPLVAAAMFLLASWLYKIAMVQSLF